MDHRDASIDPNSSDTPEYDNHGDGESLDVEQLRSENENEVSLSEHFSIASPRIEQHQQLEHEANETLGTEEETSDNVPESGKATTPEKIDLAFDKETNNEAVTVGAKNELKELDDMQPYHTIKGDEKLIDHQNESVLPDLHCDVDVKSECKPDLESVREEQKVECQPATEPEESQEEDQMESQQTEPVAPQEELSIQCQEQPICLESKQLESMESREVDSKEVEQNSLESQNSKLIDVELPPVSPTQSTSSHGVSSVSPAAKTATNPPSDMLHHIKNIHFKDKKVGIVTQNENGPCPLVAILNVLLLRRQITLPNHSGIVAASKLMEYIGDAMLENVPKNLSGEVRLNYEQNMHDAMAVLPKLQTGLDVNVKFTGVRDFEYTPECIIFDLLEIPLFHGWLVDPQTPEVVSAVGQAGYNQLVEKVITQKCSNDQDALIEALVIENFLERSASQLTYHGLSELTSSMNDDEIGVLFRNNHFSTIYKHQKELLQLVTDQGFLAESNFVWETLGSIDGDGQFVDSSFRTVPPKPDHSLNSSSASPNTSAQLTAEQQIDHDFLVALSLQEEPEQPTGLQDDMMGDIGEDVAKTLSENEKTTQELMDLELARQLQQEEERQAAEAEMAEREASGGSPRQQPAATGSRSPPPQPSKKKENCTFL